MFELNNVFYRLMGREPTNEERATLSRLRDVLNLGNDDAFWLLFVALEYYKTCYMEMPHLAVQEAATFFEKINETAHTMIAASIKEIQASVEQGKADLVRTRAELARAVAAAAREVAFQTSTKQMFKWITVAFLGAFLFGWVMYQSGRTSGYQVGYASGYREAKDQKAAASWANTPEGRLAYRLAQLGELQRLARCEGKGWEIKEVKESKYVKICLPMSDKDVVHGWAIPSY